MCVLSFGHGDIVEFTNLTIYTTKYFLYFLESDLLKKHGVNFSCWTPACKKFIGRNR